MDVPLSEGGPYPQNDPLTIHTCKPRGEIDLFWTPEGMTPSQPEWKFPARVMQGYYNGRFILSSRKFKLPPNTNFKIPAKDEKKKLRAARIAKVTHLEEKLLDRACYELDITGDASFMSNSSAFRSRIFQLEYGRQQYSTAQSLFTNLCTTSSSRST